MKDYALYLAFLFSLSLHGGLATLLFLPHKEVAKDESFTIAVEWERALEIQTDGVPAKAEIHKIAPHSQKVAMANCDHRERQKKTILVQSNMKKTVREKGETITLIGREIPPEKRTKGSHLSSLFTPPPTHQQGKHNDGDGPATNKNESTSSSKKAYQPLPKYPWISRKRRQEGSVCLAIQTDGKGQVTSARLQKTSGYPPLDQSALAAVKTWVFIEGPSQKLLTIAFRFKK